MNTRRDFSKLKHAGKSLEQAEPKSEKPTSMQKNQQISDWQRKHPPGKQRTIDPNSEEGRAIAARLKR